jgi:hypothetical protein
MIAAHRPPDRPTSGDAMTDRAVRLRLFASLVAISAGVAALVIAILFLRTALG